MTETVGHWRARYTPGDWLVLAGPTSLVVLEPPPNDASSFIEGLWESVVESASMPELATRLAAFQIDRMPSFAAFFWTHDGMRSLVRGAVTVTDPASGSVLASGDGIQTWTETGHGHVTRVRLTTPAGSGDPADGPVLSLPLVVGAVRAGTIELDADETAVISSPQTASAPALPPVLPVVGVAAAEPDLDPSERSGGQTDEDEAAGEDQGEEREGLSTELMDDPFADTGFDGEPVGEDPVDGPEDAGDPFAESQDGVDQDGEDQDGEDQYGEADDTDAEAASGEHYDPAAGVDQSGYGQPDPFAPAGPAEPGAPYALPAPFGVAAAAAGPPVPGPPAPGPPAPGGFGSPPGPRDEPYQPSMLDELENGDTQLMMPTAAPAGRPSASEPGRGPGLLAVTCPYGHHSPPNHDRCRVCGTPIPPQQPRMVPPPVLAVLRSSDGTSVGLDRAVLIGRAPSGERASTRDPRLMTVPSPGGDISRTHAEVAPDGWQIVVTDLNSTNGTIVVAPGHPRRPLPPGSTEPIQLGSVIELGDGVSVLIDFPQ